MRERRRRYASIEWASMARPGLADDSSQMSLFDAFASAEVAPTSSAGPPPATPAPEVPRRARGRAAPESDPVPSTPSPSTSRRSELAPLTFRHPQAEREVVLGEHRVGYAL